MQNLPVSLERSEWTWPKTNNSDRKQIQKSLSFTCGLEVHPLDVLNVELVQTAKDIEMMPIFDIYGTTKWSPYKRITSLNVIIFDAL